MHGRLSMNNLQYPRDQLLQKVKDNRQKHNESFDFAMLEYRKQLQSELENKLQALKEGKEVQPNSKLLKPVQYLKDYDRAISMLEMTSTEQVELDQNGFAQLILDEWDWSHNFLSNTEVYASAMRP